MKGFQTLPNCDCCGRFHRPFDAGASFAMRFDGWPPTPSHEAHRCAPCTAKRGALGASSGFNEDTAGLVPPFS